MEDEEKDLVVFEDEDGNQITLQVLDYLYYEGKEYAMLTDPDDGCDGCERKDCKGCEASQSVYIMEVVNIDDDTEEFIEVEDQELADTILDIFQNSVFDVEDESIDLSELLGVDGDDEDE